MHAHARAQKKYGAGKGKYSSDHPPTLERRTAMLAAMEKAEDTYRKSRCGQTKRDLAKAKVGPPTHTYTHTHTRTYTNAHTCAYAYACTHG